MTRSPERRDGWSPTRAEEALAKLTSFKTRFDLVLSQFLSREIEGARSLGPEVGELLEVGAEFALRGGKRVRPAFLFHGYKAVNGAGEETALAASMSIELLHAGILVHDDIIDNSELRRGKPTVHRILAERYGNQDQGRSLAIVVGDRLLAMANDVLSGVSVDGENARLARRIFDRLCVEINDGQWIDVSSGFKGSADWDLVMKVMEYKTAKYTVERPLQIGAALGGAREGVLSAFSRYGIPLGIAFQLQDDILGMFGNEEEVGKPVDSDLKEGKQTILVLETRRRLTDAGRAQDLARFRTILGDPHLTQEDYHWTRGLMEETGARESVRVMAQRLIGEAQSALTDVSIAPEVKNYLLGIADFMLDREY